ncbi:hypothetical protein PRNP1_012488 [Phytophthora ramorum]
MATTGPLPAPYDDGSSTESEYYFDPEEEEAPYEHEPQVKQEPLTVQENTAIKQEYTNEWTLQEGEEVIQPPKGSEWSHGAAVVCDNAVERALAMASRFERAMSRTQREEELTADTMHSNERSTPPLKSSEEGAKTANLKKKKKVKVKSKMVSLKSVKATTPTVAAMKPVVVGLRRPPSIVTGAPIELEKGLSVPRSSSRKSPANQSSTRQKASPSHGKTKQNAQTEEKLLILRHQTERKKSPSVRRTELEKLGSKSRLQTPDESSSSTALPNHRNVTKRTPTDPRIGPPKQKNAVSHSNNNSKKPAFVHHDAFARRVFKLKLQEADVDEKTTTGSHGSDKWFYENRRRGIAAERARLMAQNLERFEILYATSTVSKSELKRYQDDRDFAWRVVQFKRKQASLQEQNDLFISPEKRVELWRRLDQDREKLIAENGAMFHKVMMSQGQTEGTFRARERDAFTTNADAPRRPGKRVHDKQLHKGQPKLYRQALGNPSTMLQSASTNSRVVVGAALADNHNTLHSQPSSVPWFLKG